jgi:adenylate kinase
MRLIIIGPPASGKGTQAEKIAEKLGIKHLSTGDIFRKIEDKEIAKYLVSGRLLPDELVFKAVKEKIDDLNDFLLDGFPRNLNQAKMLDEFLKEKNMWIDHVIYLRVPDEVVVKRMTSRRVCSKCGKNYNLISNPPPKNMKCECGGEIIQREDDKEEVIRNRLNIFKKITQPVLDHYMKKLIVVDGEPPIEKVFENICKLLKC